jgi:hypothetical protein
LCALGEDEETVGAQLADAGVFNMAHLCASSRSLHLRSDPHDDEGRNRLVLVAPQTAPAPFTE